MIPSFSCSISRLDNSSKLDCTRLDEMVCFLQSFSRLGIARILFASALGSGKTSVFDRRSPVSRPDTRRSGSARRRRRSNKDTIKPCAMQIYLHGRGEVSKTKSKIAIRPRAKANFICVLPQRSTSKIVKAGSVCTRRSALRRRSGEHCVAVVRCARRISTPFAPHRCGTNGKVWPAAESYYFVLILKNRA